MELLSILNNLESSSIKYAPFYEPDIGDELTAIALMPGKNAKEFCKRYKLAKFAPVAQRLEQPALTRRVVGLNPTRGATKEISHPLSGKVLEEYGF